MSSLGEPSFRDAEIPGRADELERESDRTRLADEVSRLQQELHQRTKALQRSEARFRDIIERNADAIVVVDGEGVIRFANAMAARLFGGTRDGLIGSSFGFPVVLGETTELDLVAGGALRIVEMRVVESEWEGRTAYLASLRDITERKRAEQSVRELIREQAARTEAEAAAHKFRFLSESSAVLTSSLDYRATLAALARVCVSDVADWAEIYGVEDEGTVRRLEVANCDAAKAARLRELRDGIIPQHSRHPILEVIRSRRPMLATTVGDDVISAMTVSERHREIVSEIGITSFMMMPMIARDRVLGAIALFSSSDTHPFDEQDLALAEDIAARAALALDNAKLYEEARRANQTKSDFLAVVSHDLRTPLNAIMGYAELLHMGIPERVPDAARERLERIRTSAGHLLYLLDELLDFARLEAGRERLHVEEADIRAIAREARAIIEPLASAAGLWLELEESDEPVIVHTDRDKVRQVLVNLGGNAVKYTPRGEVRITVEKSPAGEAVIRVSDTGIGIAREHLDWIFEPFWQVEPGRRGRSGGTGLGLSVVRGLVQLLNGRVCVKSAPNEGSTFTVHLPDLGGDSGRG